MISVCNIQISGQKNDSNVHHLNFQRKTIHIKHGKRLFPAPKDKNGQTIQLFFGVLLPEAAPVDYKGCTYSEAVPAMELAIKKLQQPGGVFEHYSISVEYRDTKTTSVHGVIAAFDLYTKQPQG